MMRSGVTLTEILIAAAILAGALVAALNLFAITQKQAGSSEALLQSGTLAQLVIERIKSSVNQNPRYLRELMAGQSTWSMEGTVVDPASSSSGSALQLSPFFSYLFTRDAAELCQPPNQVTLKPAAGGAASATGIKADELTALFDTFRDYKVKVTVADDDAPIGTDLAPGPGPEAVKRITVTVSRASVVAAKGADPLAYTVTTRMVTPADSLSKAALDQLAANFDGPPLEDQWNEYLSVTGTSNPYLDIKTLGDDSKKILADAFIIVSRANNESQLVDGKSIPGTQIIPPPDASQKFIDEWITELSAPGVVDLASSKRELAHLRARKAGVIFDTYKKIRLAEEHLLLAVFGPGGTPLRDKVTALNTAIKGFMAQITTMESSVTAAELAWDNAHAVTVSALTTDTLLTAETAEDTALRQMQGLQAQLLAFQQSSVTQVQSERETVVLISLLQQFYSDPDFKDVAARPGDYDTNFKTTLDQMSDTLVAHLAEADATPYELMAAAKLYEEVTRARQLVMGTTDTVAQARIKTLASSIAPKMADLARYLANSEVNDQAGLTDRNQRFSDRSGQLKVDAPQYKQLAAYFGPGGPAQETITLYENFAGKLNLDPKSVLGTLNAVIALAVKDDSNRPKSVTGGKKK